MVTVLSDGRYGTRKGSFPLYPDRGIPCQTYDNFILCSHPLAGMEPGTESAPSASRPRAFFVARPLTFSRSYRIINRMKDTVNAWISLDSETERRELVRMQWKMDLTPDQKDRLVQVVKAAELLIHREMDILRAEIAV